MIFIYVLLLITSFIFYIQFEGVFSFYLFCFVAAYPVVFGLITYSIKRKLRISFEVPEQSAPKGMSIPVNIIIDNNSRFPVPNCDISIKYCSDVTSQSEVFKIHTPIFPNNSQTLTARISYDHYGSITLEIKKVKIFDILRVVRFKVKSSAALNKTKIIVFPNHIPLENKINDYSDLGLESESYSKNKKGDDPSEIFDIHEYNEGDKISRIHWKLSAKQDDMMVKDYSLPITNGVLIAADFSHLKTADRELDKFDAVIDAVSAISLHLAENEVIHTAVWCAETENGSEKAVIGDFESFSVGMKRLINEGFRKSPKSIPEITAAESEGVPRFAHMILCTTEFTDTERELLTESGCAYKYTVVEAGGENKNYFAEGSFEYVPLAKGAIAESIENIAI